MNGRVYLAKSGQWAWCISDNDGNEDARGAGYETAKEAEADCYEHLPEGGKVTVEDGSA